MKLFFPYFNERNFTFYVKICPYSIGLGNILIIPGIFEFGFWNWEFEIGDLNLYHTRNI